MALSEVADSPTDFKSEDWKEFVDRLYVMTLMPIDEQTLKEQFVLYGQGLQTLLNQFEYYNLTELLMDNEEVSSFLKVYVRKVKNYYLKFFFNEKGYQKYKKEKEEAGIPFDLQRPEKTVRFPNRYLFLLEDRFKEGYARGRVAFVKLLGHIYDPQEPNRMIQLSDTDELIRIHLSKAENLYSFSQFRKKYFPNMKILSRMISHLCWEEIEFDPLQQTLKLLIEPNEFEKNLKLQLDYRRKLLDILDRRLSDLKEMSAEELKKYKPMNNKKERSPLRRRYCGCDTSSEDDMTRRYQPFSKSEIQSGDETENDKTEVSTTTPKGLSKPTYKKTTAKSRDDSSSSDEDLRARNQPVPFLKPSDDVKKASEEEFAASTPIKLSANSPEPDSPDLVPVPTFMKLVRPFYDGPPSEDEEYDKRQREKNKRFGADAIRPKYNLVPEN